MTGEEILLSIGFTKERYDGFDYFDNGEWAITFYDYGIVKIDSIHKPVITIPMIHLAIAQVLNDRGYTL